MIRDATKEKMAKVELLCRQDICSKKAGGRMLGNLSVMISVPVSGML